MAEKFDLAVRGGIVVGPHGRAPLDLYARDGKVAALVPRDQVLPASRVIDAGDQLVLPGMVDTHVHLMEPGDTSREDFLTGTTAAACSGITTIVEHTHGWPVSTEARLAEKRAHLEGRSFVDYGLAAHAWPEHLDQVPALWQAGVTFFKVFTCATHGVPAMTSDLLLDLFDTLSDLGAACLVHCEDDLITARAERRLRAAGRSDGAVIPEWRSREAELVATASVALFARLTGAKATIAHVSHPGALELVAAEQRAGSTAVAETCPQYLLLQESEVLDYGPLRKFTPPARSRCAADGDAMWSAFNTGGFHHLSTDHAPSTAEQKLRGGIFDCPFGLPGLDTTVALMVDAALSGRTSLERVVAAYAAAPARRYGLAGKGRLAMGSDADVVVVDPAPVRTLTDESVRSKAGWTPYAGRTVRGQVRAVALRGEIVAQDGELTCDPSGHFLPGPGAR